MASTESNFRTFLQFWFEGFGKGLGRLDEDDRNAMLRECGQACARSYTAEVFKEAWERSGDIDGFLINLAQRFPGADYRRVGDDRIEVRYRECACDLVAGGYIKTPLFCRCSAENLKANFEGSLNRPVSVTIKSSILGGAEQCMLVVDLKEE